MGSGDSQTHKLAEPEPGLQATVPAALGPTKQAIYRHYIQQHCLYFQYLALQRFLILRAATADEQGKKKKGQVQLFEQKEEEQTVRKNQSDPHKARLHNCYPRTAFKCCRALNTKPTTEHLNLEESMPGKGSDEHVLPLPPRIILPLQTPAQGAQVPDLHNSNRNWVAKSDEDTMTFKALFTMITCNTSSTQEI